MDAHPPGGPAGDRPDRDLLRAFADRADQAAFAELVRRHGPIVLAACRRVLAGAHDADDVFQAVFLVLARKANAVARPERLAGWLYGVALRCARRVRSAAATRQTRERPMSDVVDLPDVPKPSADSVWEDVGPVLDEEIGRLPNKFRDAVVLCELQGVARAEAAGRLGVTAGTLSSRLARARDTLRSRLVRRGVCPAAGIGAVLAAAAATAAAVPPPLLAAVTAAAVRPPGGPAVAVERLVRQEVAAGLRAKVAWVGAVGVVVLAAAGLGWSVAARVMSGPSAPIETAHGDRTRLQGEWQVTAVKMGSPEHEAVLLGTRVAFREDRVTYFFESTYTLDARATPKRIDMTAVEGDAKGVLIRAVYRLDGDTLTLNVAQHGGPRPAGFEPDGARTMLLTLERVRE
jgi:RNA polymerase sigma factor (sigma-70 family)